MVGCHRQSGYVEQWNRINVVASMSYSVGSRVRVKLYSGKEVEAEITAITNQSAGRKSQIVYGSVTASINPEQIIEVVLS